MRTQTLHLRILIFLLTTVGILLTAYQIVVLKLPVSEAETDYVWNIDAKVQFDAADGSAVKLKAFVPPLRDRFLSLNESFISRDYGVSVDREDDNRRVTWSSRRASGAQTLFYRLAISSRFGGEPPVEDGPVYRDPIEVDEAEQVAVDALLAPIREYSADVETFISEAIKRLSQDDDDHVRILTQGESTPKQKAHALEVLLAAAHVPMERVHVLNLSAPNTQELDLWIRSFNGKRWLYFEPVSGAKGLPDDRLVWWHGDDPFIDIEGGKNARVQFTVNDSEVNALRLGQIVQDANAASRFLDYSLYGLPLSDQQTYQLIVMIPVGVLFILLLRNIIGLQTLGTFTPVLIGMAFRETGLGFGILFFTIITTIGLMLRGYLEYLKLQLLPRLSVVLTFVVIVMAGISLLSYRLGVDSGLSVSLFPMVILTMTIERLSISWDERGGNTAFRQGVTTLFAAAGAYYLMNLAWLKYFVFTFPGVLLLMLAFMLLMGRYRGYRLSELIRFRALVKE